MEENLLKKQKGRHSFLKTDLIDQKMSLLLHALSFLPAVFLKRGLQMPVQGKKEKCCYKKGL